MLKRNYCIDILIENATSYSEKSKIYALNEAEQAIVNDKMVGNLYKSALKRKDIDFGDIPNSKGDIQKFGGYSNMVATLDMLKALSKKFGINIPEVDIVEDAINNIRVQKKVFEKGYTLNIDFMKMYYQALVLACVDATTLLLASYVEFTRTLNNIEFQVKRGKGISGNICIDSLAKFNQSVKDGSFNKFADGLMSKKQEEFLGTAAVASLAGKTMVAAAIGASIVPVLRLLIFYFYDAKISVAEQLQYQKELLEMNAFRLNSSSMEAQKRNKILDKQKRYIDRLEKMSDKIRVSDQLANKSTVNNIKQDNKQWNLSNVTNDGDDFMFI
jgi:hypothetical protein